MANQSTKSAVAADGPEKTDQPSPVQPNPVRPNPVLPDQVQPSPAPSLFAMFVKLEDRSCLVVGAGSLAEPKISGLFEAGARVGVVAPQANATVSGWALAGKITWKQRCFEPADLDGAFLVIAATGASAVNQRVFREARERGVLCNAADDPGHCDFYYPAVVRRGALQFAISTGGLSPALAQRLRRELEEQFGPEYAEWVAQLGRSRQQIFARDLKPEDRRKLLHELASREAFAATLAKEGLS